MPRRVCSRRSEAFLSGRVLAGNAALYIARSLLAARNASVRGLMAGRRGQVGRGTVAHRRQDEGSLSHRHEFKVAPAVDAVEAAMHSGLAELVGTNADGGSHLIFERTPATAVAKFPSEGEADFHFRRRILSV